MWSLGIVVIALTQIVTDSFAEPIRGVNLGGWLLVEEWITPSLFYSTDAEDEWHLCSDLGKDRCRTSLESHWSDFLTRDDFEDMASAGLNAVRIPIGYWAIDVRDDEPYVDGQYPYLIQAVQWAQELGLQVMIDLHGAPGSQNGQDNSGLIGPILFPRNSSNTKRSLDVLRNFTEEFSQDIYSGVVTAIELLNEPRLDDDDFPMSQLKEFYSDGTEVVSSASSETINVTIHDAFWGPSYWSTYDPLPNRTSSPVTLDTHQYYAFPPYANLSQSEILTHICEISHLLKNTSLTQQHSIIVGEFSLETNASPTTLPEDSESQKSTKSHPSDPSRAQRTWYRLLFESQAVAYAPSAAGQPSLGWYFWTWKTEWDIDTWSYRRGWRDGWIPADVGNASTFAYPVLEDGCVDADFPYEAPAQVGGVGGLDGRLGSCWWLILGLMTVHALL
ncbi:hypothetical protein Q7P37_001785 [Cladosporium fusiforme]